MDPEHYGMDATGEVLPLMPSYDRDYPRVICPDCKGRGYALAQGLLKTYPKPCTRCNRVGSVQNPLYEAHPPYRLRQESLTEECSDDPDGVVKASESKISRTTHTDKNSERSFKNISGSIPKGRKRAKPPMGVEVYDPSGVIATIDGEEVPRLEICLSCTGTGGYLNQNDDLEQCQKCGGTGK